MNTAIVLAAGKGSRMKSEVAKQYMLIRGYPVIYYSLKVFEEYERIDQVILVTSKDSLSYSQTEIVEKYGFTKVKAIVPGGAERYDSVYEGLKAASDSEYVMIHDGARPMINREILDRCLDDTIRLGSGVAGMPVKDTIKVVDSKQTVVNTPDRSSLWLVQTPQTFCYQDIYDAYRLLYEKGMKNATDDAMVLETMMGHQVHMSIGSYENIKITTPEDLALAELFLD